MALSEERIVQPAASMAAMLTASLSIALGASLAKFQMFPLVGAEGATGLRGLSAALLLLVFVRPWRGLPARDKLIGYAAYGCTIAIMNLLFYMALQRIPFGLAVAIEFIGPLAVTVFSSRRAIDFAWIALAAAGLLLLLPIREHSGSLDPAGIGFALGSAFCWAIYIILGKRLSAGNGLEAVSYAMLFSALVTVPYGLAHAGAGLFGWQALALGLSVGALSSALPYCLQMYALRRMPKNVFSLTLSMEPAISALAGMALLGEFLSLSQWVAVACIVIASFGATRAAS